MRGHFGYPYVPIGSLNLKKKKKKENILQGFLFLIQKKQICVFVCFLVNKKKREAYIAQFSVMAFDWLREFRSAILKSRNSIASLSSIQIHIFFFFKSNRGNNL